MKLTYTIEVDIVRESGPHVSKADLSAEVIDRLIEVGQQTIRADGSVAPGHWEYLGRHSESEYLVKGWTVYPHEGSEAEAA